MKTNKVCHVEIEWNDGENHYRSEKFLDADAACEWIRDNMKDEPTPTENN